LVAGVCGAYGPWVDQGAASVPSPYTDSTTVDATCYQYRVQVWDNVDNPMFVTSPSVLLVDRTPPTGTIAAAPTGPAGGIVTFTGTAADAGSGVQLVNLKASGPGGNFTICLGPATPAHVDLFLGHDQPGSARGSVHADARGQGRCQQPRGTARVDHAHLLRG